MATTNSFAKQLHNNLEAVEDRAKSLRENVESAAKKSQADIQSALDEARTRIEAKKQEFDEYRAKLKSQFEEKESEVRSDIDEWKTNREVKKLGHRADRAEDYASTSIFLAIAAIEEAEEAALLAISTRLDVETAVGQKK